ncbi:MAG: methyltransferase domain-containing protein [Candidatus Bathyarchaeota archaeon]|nr:methyltransferase domain-containing protein [Candidatus Bathyarchaeota archaeon]
MNVPSLGGWLSVQSVPRLAEKHGVQYDLPPEHMLYGLSMDELGSVIKRYEELLDELMTEHGVTWWDAYIHSDVGKERLELVNDLSVMPGDSVLDVGCGKEYTTVALAQHTEYVTGLDMMNGYGRKGWWHNYWLVMQALGLQRETSGSRSSATEIPFRDGGFSLSASCHALRTFGDRRIIVDSLREMKRVTIDGGRVVVAENIPVARSKPQEAHLAMFELRTQLIQSEIPYLVEEQLEEMFLEAGLTPSRIEIKEYPYSATPPGYISLISRR